MNIAFVNATHRWGGVKSWTLRVGQGLIQRGHRVALFARSKDSFAEAASTAGFQVRTLRFGPDYNPLAVWRLRRWFEQDGVEVVVTNVSKDNRIGGPAARRAGLPVLQRVGGPGDIRDRPRVAREHRRYVTHVVVPARHIREQLSSVPWMRAMERVTVVPNGVDLDRFQPGRGRGRLRALINVGPDVPLIVTTGQLTRIKGHRLLLEAVAALPKDRPPSAVVLIGRGAEEEALRAQTERLGLAGRVHFLGFRQDLDLLLEDADIAAQPSLAEGFPNSVIEFLAKGKAVVATRLAGVPEAITHGEDGLLVPAGDVPALTAALADLLADPQQRSRLGARARSKAVSEFSAETMIERVETLLQRVIQAGVH